jgi:hypothetical protein
VPEWLRLRNHIIFVTIFSSIDFKKRLSRRDIDKSFHLSIAQDKVRKIPQKLHKESRDIDKSFHLRGVPDTRRQCAKAAEQWA